MSSNVTLRPSATTRPQAGGYVPKDLFEKRFLCVVPVQLARTEAHIHQFGTPTTGIPHYDNQIKNEWGERWIPICASEDSGITSMLDLMRRGVPIRLKQRDIYAKVIYEIIENHLLTWKEYLERASLNVRQKAPFQDLIDLDRLAEVVYKHVEHRFTEEVRDSLLANSMSKILSVDSLLTDDSVKKEKQPVTKPRTKKVGRASLEMAPLKEKPSNVEIVQPGDNDHAEEPARPQRESLAAAFMERARTPAPKWK